MTKEEKASELRRAIVHSIDDPFKFLLEAIKWGQQNPEPKEPTTLEPFDLERAKTMDFIDLMSIDYFLEPLINESNLYKIGLFKALQAIDFLRSKGYALPFKEYSIEQMIEMGWLKLEE